VKEFKKIREKKINGILPPKWIDDDEVSISKEWSFDC
jgi:hypothetical protein